MSNIITGTARRRDRQGNILYKLTKRNDGLYVQLVENVQDNPTPKPGTVDRTPYRLSELLVAIPQNNDTNQGFFGAVLDDLGLDTPQSP